MTAVFMDHPEWRFVRQGKDGRSKPRGMRRPARRIGEGLIYVAPLLAMDFTMIKKFGGVSLRSILESGNYDTHAYSNDTQTPVPTTSNVSCANITQLLAIIAPPDGTRALPYETLRLLDGVSRPSS